MNVTDLERFERMIEHTENGCWLFRGGRNEGYGIFTLEDGEVRKQVRKQVRAHRWYYEQMIGPIPKGLTLDHLCHKPPCTGGVLCKHRRCVRPDHMEPVTRKENRARQNHAVEREAGQCANGHDPDQNEHGKCRQCHRDRAREYGRRQAQRKKFQESRDLALANKPDFYI